MPIPTNWHTTSRHERGYGNEWDKVRRLVLKRDNYLCQCDQCEGGIKRITPAREVHHRVSKAKGGSNHPSNLISLSRDCHKRLDALEQGKKLKPKIKVGLDGYPLSVR